MTAGYRVLCSDGNSRHTELFPTRRDALTWQTYRHVCPFGHRIRKEATWEVESFRLRPPKFPSAPQSPLMHSPPAGGAEGTLVGTGDPSPSLADSVAPESPTHQAPVPTTLAGAR